MTPKVTVLLPVFNAERYLRECLDSILSQDFDDYELIAIDDGSTDGSRRLLSAYRDRRLRLISHTRNQRLISTLNEGLAEARGEYVARIDADDVAEPHRLSQQVSVLNASPDVALVGSAVRYIDHAGNDVDKQSFVWEDGIELGLCFGNVICHPSVMFRRTLASELGGYDGSAVHVEDYDLWARMVMARCRITCVHEPLLKYRLHDDQISAIYQDVQTRSVPEIGRRLTEWFLNRRIDDEEYRPLSYLMGGPAPEDWAQLRAGLRLWNELLAATGAPIRRPRSSALTRRLWYLLASASEGSRLSNPSVSARVALAAWRLSDEPWQRKWIVRHMVKCMGEQFRARTL